MVVFLNSQYIGNQVYESYHYNVVTNEVVVFEEPVSISPQQIKKYTSKNINTKKFKERMKYLLQRIDKIVIDRRINEITTNAMKEMNEKYPQKENPVFTQEMISFLSEKIAKEFVLSFQHRFSKKN
ncbi:hypothetical protein [Aquisalibacillus elongatus]|uniref:hypothetical protein n=1 Tax=Aquisalibacillus elongatus TaxID=485577 RepID=UPI001474D526|nr:hypothetical protein [Aquisalibacillus elongatus]